MPCVCVCVSIMQLEKFIDGKWQAVAPGHRLKITQLDGQVRGAVPVPVPVPVFAVHEPESLQPGPLLLPLLLQVWLSLVNLLVEPACRAKYDPDGYRWAHALLKGREPSRQLSPRLGEPASISSHSTAGACTGHCVL